MKVFITETTEMAESDKETPRAVYQDWLNRI
jgi:hypothetical protein